MEAACEWGYLKGMALVSSVNVIVKEEEFGMKSQFNGSQLAKMEKSIPHMSLPWNLWEEAVGLKNSNYTWKIMIFANMWNLGQFCEKSVFCQ